MAEGTDDAAFRAEVRRFIATHAPAVEGRDGLRVPRDADEARAIRTWLGALYGAGYLGAGWPPEWGGRADHHPTRDLVLMSLMRPTMRRYPSASSVPRSPVCSQPSPSMAVAVASGSSR